MEQHTANKIERKARHCYRCIDCLTVVFTDEKIADTWDKNRGNILVAECGACGGRMEYLGATTWNAGTVRRIESWQCACDGRCTSATGPSCDCQCGGENHGTGRVVPVYRDQAVPRVMAPADAVGKAAEYRGLVAEFKAAHDRKYGWINRKKAAGEWIENYDFYMDGQYSWKSFIKAKSIRTHAGRNKKLRALIAVRGSPKSSQDCKIVVDKKQHVR